MPSPSAFTAYRLGVRLEQLAGLRELPESTRIDQAKAALWERLILAAGELRDEQGPVGIVAASIRESHELLTRFRHSQNINDKEQHFATMQSYANGWKSELVNFGAAQSGSSEFAMWFELGVEIASGTDNFSEGRPRIQADGMRSIVTVVDSRPHRWDVLNQERVEQLFRQLDVTWEDVFREPSAENRIDDFDELPEDISWPWCNIENALRSLAVRLAPPVWNDTDRTLTVKGQVVRRFAKAGENQMKAIRAFVDAGWARTVDCPFSDSGERRQTLTDLNRNTQPKLIFFSATGDDRLRWSFTELGGSE